MPQITNGGAERVGTAELQRQAGYFDDGLITRHLLDAVPNILLILNPQRQIIYANRTLFELTGIPDDCSLIGLRPGEALHCVHSTRTAVGCGGTENCQACGVLDAVLASQDGSQRLRECRVTRNREGQVEALDLRVLAIPLQYREESFTIFSIADISHEKRRQVLERLFFHDILNLVGGIRGFTEILLEPRLENAAPVVSRIRQTAERIIDEIQAQRTLVAAENQDLQPKPEPVAAGSLVSQVCAIYRSHEVCRERELRLDESTEGGVLTSDATLLGRVLGNMVKNAVEATPHRGVVTVGSRDIEGEVEFWVHNPGAIPVPVRLQIFQRSFSTRGAGRGLGTYSMRLLTEDYLGGVVGFTSSDEHGTRFFARYPRRWPGL